MMSSMNMIEAQSNMRYAYFGGCTGVFASALVWLAAGIVALDASPKASMLTLFFGGMLIHPAAIIFSRMLKRPGAHSKGNPMGFLAIKSTVILLLGLALAFAVANVRAEWFFPAMLLVIGGRYLLFSSIYGLRIYWLCGVCLALAGVLLAVTQAPFVIGPFTGGVIELVFACAIFFLSRKEKFE